MNKYYAWIGIATIVVLTSTISVAAEKPKLFNVTVQDIPNEKAPLVKPWKTIVLDKEYRGAWIVAGDLTGDGKVEIVSARNYTYGQAPADSHYTTSVAAHRLDGSLLWKWGDYKAGRSQLHHDVACQIYDWNGDGKNEVIIAAKEELVELDGATGKVKRKFALPADASDCVVFCNLSGKKRATDILVKTRYSKIWAYNYEGKNLWSVEYPGGYLTAHQPRPVDIDEDGRDEILAGFAMLNSNGTLRWVLKSDGVVKGPFAEGINYKGGHLDCGRALRMVGTPGKMNLVMTFCPGERLAMTDGTGRFQWSITGYHFESIDVGKVCANVPGEQIVVDIPYAPKGKKPIWVLDEKGNLLGTIVTTESRFHRLVDWTGDGVQEIIVGQDHCMFDGTGKKIAVFEMPTPKGEFSPFDTEESIICAVGDMTGDGIPDTMYYTNPGSVVYIYQNKNGEKPKPKIPLGTGVNFTLY